MVVVMKGIIGGVLVLLTLLSLAACRPAAPGPAGERIRVAVSVPPQAWFVERIGGGRVQVDVMIPPGYSHVDYPLTPRQVVALSRARLYVAVGHPAFEFERIQLFPFLTTLPGLQVVDMSRGMQLLAGEGEGEEGHGHSGQGHSEGAEGDPHVWVAPATVAVAGRNIAAALEGIDPAHAAEYRANLARFEADVAAVDQEIRAELAPFRGSRFMVYHPTWGYFAHEYGLQQVAIEAEGKEPSAQRLIQLIGAARRNGVKVVFVQRGYPRKSAQVIADEVGGSVVTADPQERDWLGNLRRVSRELRGALEGPRSMGPRALRSLTPGPSPGGRGVTPAVGLAVGCAVRTVNVDSANSAPYKALPVRLRPPSPLGRGAGGEVSKGKPLQQRQKDLG
ncbi:MAG: zinc transport system substrate-binding protein [Acidobacteriota bacterium]|jgi:zinc transport system substrate-binding protein|nr:zinc transport system substrate-binding protein [Acidobacteriota bacterium]